MGLQVRYNAKQLAQYRSPREIRVIKPRQADMEELRRVYLEAIKPWRSAAVSLMPVYASALASGSTADLAQEQDSRSDEIAVTLLALRALFQARFQSIEEWHRLAWVQRVKSAIGTDVGMLLERTTTVAGGYQASRAGQVGLRAVGGSTAVVQPIERQTILSAAKEAIVPTQAAQTPLTALVDNAVNQNMTLAKAVSEEIRARIANVLFNGVQLGKPTAGIARQVNEILNKAGKRAKRIAVNEVEKITTLLTQYRAIEAGMGSFRWIHTPQPHPRHWHLARHGNVYKWEEAPEDLPSVLPNCKCLAQPVILDDAGSRNPVRFANPLRQ